MQVSTYPTEHPGVWLGGYIHSHVSIYPTDHPGVCLGGYIHIHGITSKVRLK